MPKYFTNRLRSKVESYKVSYKDTELDLLYAMSMRPNISRDDVVERKDRVILNGLSELRADL